MWLWILLLVGGFLALVWSADVFVKASGALARNLGVSDLIIGLTFVSIGTSAPEILVAIVASFDSPSIAIGNAIGSNIANMGLVLGATALVVPLPFAKRVLRSEIPMLLIATALTAFCLANLYVGRVDGFLLIGLLSVIMYRLVKVSKASDHLPEEIEDELEEIPDISTARASLRLIVGLVVLLGSAHVIVHSAQEIARLLGVSEMIIGLTIVAAGTSLPELAATMVAAVQGRYSIAIGNVIGSNVLNILVVLAIPAFLHPSAVSALFFWQDFGVMFLLTLLLALFAYGFGANKVITRFEGGVFLAAYVGYLTLLYVQST